MNQPYDERKLDRWNDGLWCRFPFDFLEFLTTTEAVVFSTLIFAVAGRLRQGQGDNGWVRVPNAQLVGLLRNKMAVDTVNKTITKLVNKKVVERKQRGLPARRWVRISTAVIDQYLLGESPESKKRIPPHRDDHPNVHRDDHPNVHRDDHPNVYKEVDSLFIEWTSLASRLKDAVQTVRTISKNSSPKKWGEHIKRLHTTDGVSIEKIKEILDWYCKVVVKEGDIISNGNPNYIPIAFSGAKFREKFDKVEAAMAREKFKHQKENREQGFVDPVKMKKAKMRLLVNGKAHLFEKEPDGSLKFYRMKDGERKYIKDPRKRKRKA